MEKTLQSGTISAYIVAGLTETARIDAYMHNGTVLYIYFTLMQDKIAIKTIIGMC